MFQANAVLLLFYSLEMGSLCLSFVRAFCLDRFGNLLGELSDASPFIDLLLLG